MAPFTASTPYEDNQARRVEPDQGRGLDHEGLVGDDLVTYRAVGRTHGWIVVYSVAGAAPHLRHTRPVPNLELRTRKGRRNEDA